MKRMTGVDKAKSRELNWRAMNKSTLLFALLTVAFVGGCKPSAQEQLAQKMLDQQAKFEALPDTKPACEAFLELAKRDFNGRPGLAAPMAMFMVTPVDAPKQSAAGFDVALESGELLRADERLNDVSYKYTGTYTTKAKGQAWQLVSASVQITTSSGSTTERLQ